MIIFLLRYFPLFLLILSQNVYAELPSINVSKSTTAQAEYLEGDNEKPLLIFVHGFLQTRDFSTVNRLFSALNESGFPVLSVTLSLGISNRTNAVTCEAIHLHSLQSDTDEIRQWVEWGVQKGHEQIVLIGHSAGSVNISAYLAQKPNPKIEKTILISLTYYGSNRPAAFETKADADKAKAMILNENNNLEKFSLAFCKDYISTASYFLSYYEWSDKKVLNAINVQTSENYVIIGSEDNRIGEKWAAALQQASERVIEISGANHFFDQSHEFDLLETVEGIIDNE